MAPRCYWHAPWALEDYGFNCVVSSSYADIFYNNCFKNGVLPIVLETENVSKLFLEMYASEGYRLKIDLAEQTVVTPSGESFSFEVDSFRKHCLLNGLDDIGLTLQDADAIHAYESRIQKTSPWLFREHIA
jgi:3-isopropylmalate/(R)-2-methylmalate dehydratase small subunit